MMKKFALAASLTLIAAAAFAVDGTVTFNGSITANTCKVTNGSNNNVTLPTVATSALAAAGQTAGVTPFKIILSGCSAGAQAKSLFELGSTVDQTTGALINASGDAKNVQVQLLTSNFSAITIGNDNASTYVAAPASGNLTLNYYAQYLATQGGATSGKVSTQVTYSMQYQ